MASIQAAAMRIATIIERIGEIRQTCRSRWR